MNKHKDEQWLDNELQGVIGQTDIRFDAETWKHKHNQAYQTLLARRDQRDRHVTPLKGFFVSHMGKLIAAAAIVVMATLTFLAPHPKTKQQIDLPPTSTSTDIITFKSLTLAYRHGGEEALNRQLDTAQEALGPRPENSTLSDLLKDLRG